MTILSNVKQALKRRASLQKEIEAIDRLLQPFGAIKAVKASRRGRRAGWKMSPAAKAKLSAAAKARWQKAKAAGKSRL